MGGDRPKQFLELGGIPILMHTLRNYVAAMDSLPRAMELSNRMVVVVPEDCIELWKELCGRHNFEINHAIVAGGATRFESVLHGLEYIKREINPTPCLVSVHDGVRPFVERRTLELAIKSALTTGSGVAATEVVDSIRIIESSHQNHPLNRADLRAVQTPQIFKYQVIATSYGQPYNDAFTDDSTVCQKAGHPIRLVPSSGNNIKITTAKDLAIAQFLLSGYDPRG